MQTAITKGEGGSNPNSRLHSTAVYETAVEGRFRSIPTQQLCLAWWLYREKKITRRQLRVYFAAHEMAERRRYAKDDGRRPNYTVEEVAALVGGKDSPAATAELATDIRKLARVGLVLIERRQIVFATSTDQLTVEGVRESFGTFYDAIPNGSRAVPVPRRMLRALAAGFSKAVTAVIIAMMIRSLFWHSGEGRYRVDGRTKGSWIAKVFGVSRRAVSDARSHLIELGWIEPLDVSQWELNRWGNRDRICVGWKPRTVNSAIPDRGIPVESATPLFNRKSSPTGNLKTISSNGFSMEESEEGDGKEVGRVPGNSHVPSMHDVRIEDLRQTERLLQLYRQAITADMADDCEAGMLEFFAFAERARARGHRPGALFHWLVRERKCKFITQADEDAAAVRMREHFQGSNMRHGEPTTSLSDDQRYAFTCIRVAKSLGIAEPFIIAQEGRHWSHERWSAAVGQC